MKSSPELKNKFNQAKALISHRQYEKARAVLRTIDHDTAREWLTKLDEIAPQNKRSIPRIRIVAGGFILLLILCAFFALVPPRAPVAATPTFVAAAATLELSVISSATITDTPTPTITESPTVEPTADINALATAGEAAIDPIRKPLEQFPDFQGIQSVSGLMLSDGVSINIEANVAPADDSISTMQRVSELVQKYVNPVSQIRINTHNNDQINSLWLWEDGQWSVTRLNFNMPDDPVEFIQPTAAPICPKNCTEAVALGWTEQQAGQCSNLDRDGDGVACYGD